MGGSYALGHVRPVEVATPSSWTPLRFVLREAPGAVAERLGTAVRDRHDDRVPGAVRAGSRDDAGSGSASSRSVCSTARRWRCGRAISRAEIIGMDIDPAVRRFETELGVTIWIGDQGDAAAHRLGRPIRVRGWRVRSRRGRRRASPAPGHHELREPLSPGATGGTYAIEDVGTAYVAYGGKDIGGPDTSVAMAKDLLDSVHEPATARENPFSPTAVTEARGSAAARRRVRRGLPQPGARHEALTRRHARFRWRPDAGGGPSAPVERWFVWGRTGARGPPACPGAFRWRGHGAGGRRGGRPMTRSSRS